MASLFNSKHNKYVSIPDWFKDVKPVEEQKIETKTTYIGGSGVGSATGLSNVAIYNKFVLKDAELDNKSLTKIDIALNTVESDELKIGDEIKVPGWNTSDYISVAGNSTMVVTSQIDEELNKLYGIIYYDNTMSVIGSHLLTSSPEEVTLPANVYYFKISTKPYDEFKITYKVSEKYNNDQLDLSNSNVTDYLQLNELIPEGINASSFTGEILSLLVQPPLHLTKDVNNVIKLSMDALEPNDDMFVWDKRLAAFGYDDKSKQAYSYLDGEQQFTIDENGEQIPVMTNNPEFWQYDPQLQDKWIIRTTKQRLSILDGLIEYDAEKDSFFFHKNIITSGGITMYADLGDVDIPDLYDGLPLDNKTIFWNYDENGNKINISTKGGSINGIEITGEGNGLSNVILNKEDNVLSFTKDKFLLEKDFDAKVKELSEKFVTIGDEEQYVSGIKHFENGIYIGESKVYQSQEDAVYIDGNLIVRGGIVMYADNDNTNFPDWYTSIPVASPLYWDYSSGSPILSLNGNTGSIDSIEITGNGNAITGATLTNNGKSISFAKSITFADKPYVDTQFVKKEWIEPELKKYVTLSTEQTIDGKKNFTTGGLFVNGNQIVYNSSKGYWKLDGDLLVTGGITMYGSESSFSSSNIMDAILTDGKTIRVNSSTKQLEVIGGGSGGVNEEIIKNLIESYNYIKLTDIPTATTSTKGIASFNSDHFTVSSGAVSLKTPVVTSNGTPPSYNANTLYIIL